VLADLHLTVNTTERIPAKAMTREEQSDAIVVSFAAQWHRPLTKKTFTVVLRKRIPQVSQFRWLYFHLNSPLSAICGRALIKKTSAITKTEAVALRKAINLSALEIESYVGKDATIGCYELGRVEVLSQPVPASELSSRLVYHPPQSFFILSKNAKHVINEMAGFNRTERERPSTSTK
jgi:predicted transcriptional regulator